MLKDELDKRKTWKKNSDVVKRLRKSCRSQLFEFATVCWEKYPYIPSVLEISGCGFEKKLSNFAFIYFSSYKRANKMKNILF